MSYRVSLLALAASLSTVAVAAPPAPPPKQGFSGEVDFGWVATRGNTQNSTTNFKGELNYDMAPWHYSLLGQGIGSSQSGQTTSEAYRLAGKTKYDLNPTIYLFGLLDYNKDRFSGYEHQIYETAGAGWHVFKTPLQELSLEAGIGATQSKTREIEILSPPSTIPSETRNEIIGRVGLEYLLHLSENATFSEKVSTLIGGDNTYVESTTEVRAKLAGKLDLVLGYLVKYNSRTPNGTLKTDSLSSVSLGWKF